MSNGTKASRIAGAVHEIVRATGVGGRVWTSRSPSPLDPISGAQVELLVAAVKPLRRADRIDQVGDGVASMSREEASYWHATSRAIRADCRRFESCSHMVMADERPTAHRAMVSSVHDRC